MQWRRIAVEAAAVVASILLAFGIDAWWDNRREVQAERAALVAVRTEMVRNRAALVERIAVNDSAQASVAAFLRMSPSQIRTAPEPALWRVAVNLWAPYTFDPETAAIGTFLERGEPSSNAVAETRLAAVEWVRTWEDTGEESRVLWDSSREVLTLMTAHVADLEPAEGMPPRLTLLRQDIRPRMVAIQADRGVKAAAIAKFNLQGIYSNELRELLVRTDTLLSRLNGRE